MAKRTGRGRLSSIDLLPEEAEPIVVRALQALKRREHTQAYILRQLNEELEGIGLNPISKSSFHRKALWVAAYGRQMQHAREIASVIGDKLGDMPEGDVGLLLGETIKTLIFDVLSEVSLSGKSPSMGMLAKAAEAVNDLERARAHAIDTKVKAVKEFAGKATKAVDQVAKDQGLTKDTVAAIKSKILGVKEAA